MGSSFLLRQPRPSSPGPWSAHEGSRPWPPPPPRAIERRLTGAGLAASPPPHPFLAVRRCRYRRLSCAGGAAMSARGLAALLGARRAPWSAPSLAPASPASLAATAVARRRVPPPSRRPRGLAQRNGRNGRNDHSARRPLAPRGLADLAFALGAKPTPTCSGLAGLLELSDFVRQITRP